MDEHKEMNMKEITPDSILWVPTKLGELVGTLNALSKSVEAGFKRNDLAQEATNLHLKTLNSKVAAHEQRLNDQDNFRASVYGEAQKKAEEAAVIKSRRVAAFYSVAISLITFLVIGIVAYFIFHYLHIDLRSVK